MTGGQPGRTVCTEAPPSSDANASASADSVTLSAVDCALVESSAKVGFFNALSVFCTAENDFALLISIVPFTPFFGSFGSTSGTLVE